MSRRKASRSVVPAAKTGPQLRKGEGVPFHVEFSDAAAVHGMPAKNFNLNLASAPVPDRKYSADIGCFVAADNVVKFMFGQPQIGADRLRTLLMVVMPDPYAKAFLETMAKVSGPSLPDLVVMNRMQPYVSPPVTEEPVQVIQLEAKFALSAIMGYDACIDFFDASAFSLQYSMTSNTLHVDPVVRVTLRTTILVGLIFELWKTFGIAAPATAVGAGDVT